LIAITGAREALDKLFEIRGHARRNVRVHDCSAGTVVLRTSRQHFVRRRNVHAGEFLRDNRRDALLVCRIHEREQQRDGDRFDVLLAQFLAALPHRRFIQRLVHRAVVENALGHRQPATARSDLLRRRETHVPDVFLVTPAIFDLVAESFGRDEPRDRAVHFDQRVVGNRSAVDNRSALP
jgi:hypothetical protein